MGEEYAKAHRKQKPEGDWEKTVEKCGEAA
jgi:hypothetical protein